MKCKEHPKYQVKRKPQCLCEQCWEMWILKNILIAPKEKLGEKK